VGSVPLDRPTIGLQARPLTLLMLINNISKNNIQIEKCCHNSWFHENRLNIIPMLLVFTIIYLFEVKVEMNRLF
jgi:hypothetical protein